MRRFSPVALVVAVVCSGASMAPFVSLTSERFGWQAFTQAYQTVAIPAVARVQGSGAFFTSRIDLFHTGGGDKEVVVTYTPRADLGGTVRTAVVLLPGDTQLEVTDPLAAWFGFSGDDPAVGSLLLELRDDGGPASGDSLLAQSVVFARNDDGSEFGQFFPAQREADALVAGQVGYLATTVNAQVYRVNVGLMGLMNGTQVVVTPEDPVGTPLAAGQTFDLDAGDNRQLNNIFNVFQLAPRDNIQVAVEVTSGMALAYASVLDGNIVYDGTSDPTTILPVTAGCAGGDPARAGTDPGAERVQRLRQRDQLQPGGGRGPSRVLRSGDPRSRRQRDLHHPRRGHAGLRGHRRRPVRDPGGRHAAPHHPERHPDQRHRP